jgi:ribosomal protein L3 glutamine methyltransferase
VDALFNRPDHIKCLGELIQWGESLFESAGLGFGHGPQGAWDEAALLTLWSLGLSPQRMDHDLSRELSTDEINSARKILKRRVKERIPAAYLIRQAWFAGLAFYVDERVLVPRSPLAELIEQRLAPWIEVDRVNAILDLCAGSGCIGIACAYAFPDARVDLSDLCDSALQVARENIARHGLQHRVGITRSNLFERLEGRRYDVIISNPPYVDDHTMASLPAEFRYEPATGLAGGRDGLEIVERILGQAAKYLQPHGVLILEVGQGQSRLLEKYPQVPFIWLEFARGGAGVFVLDAAHCGKYFGAWL